jgi:hypothetical protein
MEEMDPWIFCYGFKYQIEVDKNKSSSYLDTTDDPIKSAAIIGEELSRKSAAISMSYGKVV